MVKNSLDKTSFGFSSLLAVAGHLSRGERTTLRALNAVRSVANGFFPPVLSAREKALMSAKLYDDAPQFRGGELFAWEKRWFARDLPAAPAHLLVGGCGGGRELAALLRAGYTIDAFDPAPSMIDYCRHHHPHPNLNLYTGGYEELADLVLNGESHALAPCAEPMYDAVLLGWGSFTHLTSRAEQVRCLRAMDVLCPAGAIFLSFWCKGYPGSPRLGKGRSFAFGRHLGCAVRVWRGIDSEEELHEGECFLPGLGFGYIFTEAEIEGLAHSVERTLSWERSRDVFAHASFAAKTKS